jgi:hypothetical protein
MSEYKPKRGRPRSEDGPRQNLKDIFTVEELRQRQDYLRQQRAKHQATWRAKHPEKAKEVQRRYMERRAIEQRGHYDRDAICPLCATPHKTTHAARLYCSVHCRTAAHHAALSMRAQHTQPPEEYKYAPNLRPGLDAVRALTWAQPAQQ